MEMKEVEITSRIEPLLTVADLDAFPEDDGNRYELIDGELFVSCAPGMSHQRVLHNLQVELGSYLKANPIGILVPGAGAVFSDYDAVIPDVAFVRNERWNEAVTGERFTGALDIVIEILSPGGQNRQRDLVSKHKLYGKYGCREYWIVDTENRAVLTFQLQGSKLNEVANLVADDPITSQLLPGFSLSPNTLFNLQQTAS